jgi:hypothetical protein
VSLWIFSWNGDEIVKCVAMVERVPKGNIDRVAVVEMNGRHSELILKRQIWNRPAEICIAGDKREGVRGEIRTNVAGKYSQILILTTTFHQQSHSHS